MNNDAVIVICTRPDSKRLPRKAFRRIAGLEAIDHILKRLEAAKLPVILAVPFTKEQEYRKFKSSHVYVWEGIPDSPLHRMAAAVEWYGRNVRLPKYVIRITHDDILIDVVTLQDLLAKCQEENAGYGITPSVVEGAGVEVIHTANLFQASYKHKEPIEHISYFVKGDGMPNPKTIRVEPRTAIRRTYRLTLDYPEDAVVLEAILRKLGPLASNDDICNFLDQNSHVLEYNQLPELSFYTCAYNAERWVKQTTISVMACLMNNMEYVVVDDASDDNTLLEVLSYVRNPRQFKLLVNEQNEGLASSSNIALKSCRGRYVMRVDADDKLMPFAGDIMLQKIKETGAAILYAGYKEIDAEGNIVTDYVDPRINHHAGCALMDSKLINQIKFKDGLRHWDSLELYKRVNERFPIAYLDQPLWFYRQHEASLSKSDPVLRRVVFDQVINTNGPL